MSANAASKLFNSAQVGDLKLTHRIVLCPLTRLRATDEHVIIPELASVYYSQRACVPGTLLISEGILIHHKAGGRFNASIIETEEQIAAWKKVTDSVHEKKSYIFAQMWALGRSVERSALEAEKLDYVAPSAIAAPDRPTPRALSIEEIEEYVQFYATAASNAVNIAGFDGVEIHGANGYLVDQFLQDASNTRTDKYGGSIENRARFPLEVIEATVKVVGQKKVGLRLSPWGRFAGMGMKDPRPAFRYLVECIRERYPDFAYIHVVDPRAEGNRDRIPGPSESNDFLREIWLPKTFISAGGFNTELAIEAAEKSEDLIGFGRYYISNPDLVLRIRAGIPLVVADREAWYRKKSAEGYTDWPFAVNVEEELKKWEL